MSNSSIDEDYNRYREIYKGKVRKELSKYISNPKLIGRQGKDLVGISVPRIDIPTFRYGEKSVSGVGQGEGGIGTPIGIGNDPQGRVGPAGSEPGDHILEVEFTIEELAQFLGEHLELPRIQPKGKRNITSDKSRYSSIRRVGPESLRHPRRTYKKALKREIATGIYDPLRPIVVPIREDKLYRAQKVIRKPDTNAVIFYMMDVSGSMGDEQKEVVRILAYWMDIWITSQYDGVQSRYIIHDAQAREVDQHTFYHTMESGGTKISTAYDLCQKIIASEYPIEDWNLYAFHFSDGANLGEDNKAAFSALYLLLEKVNLFGFGQVFSQYYAQSQDFVIDMVSLSKYKDIQNLCAYIGMKKDDIEKVIKTFLGKGV